MTINSFRKMVERSHNERELSEIWLNAVLRDRFDSKLKNVHYERIVIGGRIDCRLMYDTRPKCVIELKAPTEDLGKTIYLRQAHKYAHAMYIWRSGILRPILGILTNGRTAILFDGSLPFENSKNNILTLDLENNDLHYQTFLKEIESCNSSKFSSVLKTKEIPSSKPVSSSADSALARVFIRWYKELYIELNDEKKALQMVMQLYLIAICRDCGFIPTPRIKAFEEKLNWLGIRTELKKLFNAEFITFSKKESRLAWKLYNDTRELPVRLDHFPPDCLGIVYERLIRAVREVGEHRTSYFTPKELIDTVVSRLEIKKTDTVMDPTVGSAAFLVACIQRFFKNPKENRAEDLKRYIEKNLIGVDKDWYSCQIAKASLLATYAMSLPYDPSFLDRHGLNIPKVNIHCKDFFSDASFPSVNVIVGNPPWGGIDHHASISSQFKDSLKSYASYKERSDVCIYIYEKAFGLLKPGGRIGMICKLQVTEGKKNEAFREWWKGRVDTIIDYGDTPLFRNGAQTAVLLGKRGIRTTKEPRRIRVNEEVKLDFKAKGNKTIGDYFDLTVGWLSAANPVYEAYAARHPKAPFVRDIAPGKPGLSFFGINRRKLKKMAVILNEQVPKSFLNGLSPEQKKRLRDRAEVKSENKAPYAWLRTFKSELYKFNGTQTRLICPGVWSNQRIPVIVDVKGELIGITSHTIFIPKEGTSKDIINLTAAWISSKYFRFYARQPHLLTRRANGGVALFPHSIAKCALPIASNVGRISALVTKLSSKVGGGSEAELNQIDKLIYEALLELGVKNSALGQVEKTAA